MIIVESPPPINPTAASATSAAPATTAATATAAFYQRCRRPHHHAKLRTRTTVIIHSPDPHPPGTPPQLAQLQPRRIAEPGSGTGERWLRVVHAGWVVSVSIPPPLPGRSRDARAREPDAAHACEGTGAAAGRVVCVTIPVSVSARQHYYHAIANGHATAADWAERVRAE